MFLPGKAFVIDLKDELVVLGYTNQDKGSLFYIANYQKEVPKDTPNSYCPTQGHDGCGQEAFINIETRVRKRRGTRCNSMSSSTQISNINLLNYYFRQ